MSIQNKDKWDELINKEAEKIKKDKENITVIKKMNRMIMIYIKLEILKQF